MITCIAIDDESLALKQLSGYIEKTPYLKLVEKFDNAIDAIGFLQRNKVDLMFVDIEMPELNGMEFVKSLNNPPKVIFITAYSQYAVDGFRVNAVDYLLKPIGYADFLKSADKANALFNVPVKSKNDTKEETLFVKSGNQHIRIKIAEITHIEGMREYVKIHCLNNTGIMTLMSMKKLENILSKDRFMRIHRSYIINLDYLNKIERSRIIFDDGSFIPVSEQYISNVKEYIEKNSLK